MMRNSPNPAGQLEHFAAQVAHDFNNLLTGILGNLELLQYRTVRNQIPGLDGYIDGAMSAGNRAAAFAQRLLMFSGHAASPPQEIAVDALLTPLAADITFISGAGGAALRCDPAQLERAVAELLSNAAAAVAAGGEIRLETRLEGEQIVIHVHDTGCGMAPEVLARAAEAFYTTQSSGAGKGLGLAIAARIAAQYGGSLHIASQPAAGTTATLRLPRVPA